jgi:hypothetical protein
MTVAGLESFEDSRLNLAGLCLPCSKSQLAAQQLAARMQGLQRANYGIEAPVLSFTVFPRDIVASVLIVAEVVRAENCN